MRGVVTLVPSPLTCTPCPLCPLPSFVEGWLTACLGPRAPVVVHVSPGISLLSATPWITPYVVSGRRCHWGGQRCVVLRPPVGGQHCLTPVSALVCGPQCPGVRTSHLRLRPASVPQQEERVAAGRLLREEPRHQVRLLQAASVGRGGASASVLPSGEGQSFSGTWDLAAGADLMVPFAIRLSLFSSWKLRSHCPWEVPAAEPVGCWAGPGTPVEPPCWCGRRGIWAQAGLFSFKLRWLWLGLGLCSEEVLDNFL